MTLWSVPEQAEDLSSETGWSPVDTTLAPDGDGLSPEQTDADISFSSGADQAPLATVAQDGTSLSIGLDGDVPSPEVSGDTATYPAVLPGVDATLQANPAGFEENFLVDAPEDGPATLDIPLTLDGLSASLTEGGALVLTDADGNQVGGADPAAMYGAEIDPVTGDPTVQELVPATLVDGQDGPVLRLSPDPAFFTDPDVQFPIVIDPAVNLTLQEDTYVDSSNPTIGYRTATSLRSGKWSSGALYRSYLGFDRTAIAGKHVLSASLSLYETGAGSCTPTQADVYSVTSVVTPPITWDSRPTEGSQYASATAAYGGTSCPTPGTVTFSSGGQGGTTLGTLVQSWSDGTTPPAMVEVRAHSETDSTAGKVFNSSDAGSNPPALSVTYNSYPDSPTALYADIESGSTVLHGTFSDPDGSTGSVQYSIYDDTGAAVLTGSGTANVASGSDSP